MNLDARGSSGCLGLLFLLIIAAAFYAGIKFLPVYIENHHIKKILNESAFNWSNGMDEESIKQDIRKNIILKKIKNITVEDVKFTSETPWKMIIGVDYTVEITHPLLRPTILEFDEKAVGERRYE